MERDSVENNVVSSSVEAKDLFDAARMTSDITGAVTGFQALQLKRWPLVVFDGVKEVTVSVHIGDARHDTDDSGDTRRKHRPVSVEYSASTDGLPHTTEQIAEWKRRAVALASWTKELFWPDTEVTILIDNFRIEVTHEG